MKTPNRIRISRHSYRLLRKMQARIDRKTSPGFGEEWVVVFRDESYVFLNTRNRDQDIRDIYRQWYKDGLRWGKGGSLWPELFA